MLIYVCPCKGNYQRCLCLIMSLRFLTLVTMHTKSWTAFLSSQTFFSFFLFSLIASSLLSLATIPITINFLKWAHETYKIIFGQVIDEELAKKKKLVHFGRKGTQGLIHVSRGIDCCATLKLRNSICCLYEHRYNI